MLDGGVPGKGFREAQKPPIAGQERNILPDLQNQVRQVRNETGNGKRAWRCRTGRDGIALREDLLKTLIADVLGTENFEENAVEERIEKITVDGNNLIFCFTDGSEEARVWEKPKREGHKATEAQKAKMREIMLKKWTPELKEEMSMKMKALRKERGTAWRK